MKEYEEVCPRCGGTKIVKGSISSIFLKIISLFIIFGVAFLYLIIIMPISIILFTFGFCCLVISPFTFKVSWFHCLDCHIFWTPKKNKKGGRINAL